MNTPALLTVFACVLAMPAPGAMAATFNVSTVGQFRNALKTASSNGRSDTILLAAGRYELGADWDMPSENHALAITGAGVGKTVISGCGKVFYCLSYDTTALVDDAAAHVTLKGITIQDAGGAGFWASVHKASVTVDGCEFKSNYSTFDGAGLHIDAEDISAVTLKNSVFRNNRATGLAHGGGAYVQSYGPISITNNAFTGNRSLSSGGGLAAFADGSAALTLRGNVFSANVARNAAGDQGMGGGAAILTHDGKATVVNNVFAGNSAAKLSGGAQLQSLGSGSLILVNNTFYNNKAASVGGLVVWPDSGATYLYNNILYKNGGGADLGVLNIESTPVKLYNNDVYAWLAAEPDLVQQGGNINEAPRLTGLWHLLPDSPCLDKGRSTAPSLPTTDLDGNPRIVNAAVDIGADEFLDALPAAGALTPNSLNSAVGSPKSLKAVYTDVSGYRDFSAVDILVTDGGVANAIWADYNQATNRLSLRNDAGTAYQSETCAPGEVRILKNTQGSLNCAKTTMSGTGSNLIMVWDITPTVPSIASVPKKIMVRGSDSMHHTTNWVQKGSWTIRP